MREEFIAESRLEQPDEQCEWIRAHQAHECIASGSSNSSDFADFFVSPERLHKPRIA